MIFQHATDSLGGDGGFTGDLSCLHLPAPVAQALVWRRHRCGSGTGEAQFGMMAQQPVSWTPQTKGF